MNGFLDDFNRMLDRHLTPAVKTILLINVVIHLMFIFGGVVDRDAVDQVIHVLGQRPGMSFYQPWRFLTYMFIHANIWHLVFNMMVLFFFGPPLEMRWGRRGFWRFYLIVGVGAGVIHCLFTNLYAHLLIGNAVAKMFVLRIPVIGASGALYGVMLAFAAYYPEQIVLLWGILPVRIKHLMPMVILMDLFFLVIPSGQPVSYLTHMGGLAVAYVLLARMHRDWDIRTWRWR